MMKPVLDIKLFRRDGRGVCPPAERQRSQKALLWMLEGLTRVCGDQIKLGAPGPDGGLFSRKVPLLYASGVRYQREDGTEDWQDTLTTLEKGWGDCEDLAAWRTAELRVCYGRRAHPFLTFREDDRGFHYHALLWVMGPSGWRLEDPSRKLGMGWEGDFDGRPPAEVDRIVKIMDAVQKRMSPAKLARLREVG